MFNFVVGKSERGWFIGSETHSSLYVTNHGFIIDMFLNYPLQDKNPIGFNSLYFNSKEDAERVLSIINSYNFEAMKNLKEEYLLKAKIMELLEMSSPADSGGDGPNVA